MKWFWRTLFGYTVVHISYEWEVWFYHRPFRQPIIERRKSSHKLNGATISGIYYDDVDEIKDNG